MSLADQLGSIAASSGSAVLDRKKRQKIHSTSLIYDSKVAATQDYSSILYHSLDALEGLEEVNSKFGKFRYSIFSETSIGIDRNVQSKEQVNDLNHAIESYLAMVGGYWNSPLSYNSVEWLVRRFYIHIHNAEALLLSVLPYYKTPIFARVLAIIPELPPLFSWLNGVKKAKKTATRESIFKGGFNDIEFVELYINYISEQVEKKFVYSNQLIFFVSAVVASLSYNSTNEEFLDKMTRLILKLSVQLLTTDKLETQVASYTMLVVLSASVPLLQEIIDGLVETVMVCPMNDKSALTCITKLYQSLSGIAVPLKNHKKILRVIKNNEDMFHSMILGDSRFYVSFVRSLIIHNDLSEYKIPKDFEFSKTSCSVLIKDAIQASIQPMEDKSDLIDLVEYLSRDKDLFLSVLKNDFHITIAELEMNLQCVLSHFKQVENVDVPNKTHLVEETKIVEDNYIAHDKGSFLTLENEINEEFRRLLPSFITSYKNELVSEFLANVFETTEKYQTTFLLRVAVTEACPMIVRVEALKKIAECVKKMEKTGFLITIFPIVLVLLSDINKTIRTWAIDILKLLRENFICAKLDKKTSEKIFLKEDIFGARNSKKLIVLSPKDSLKLIDILLNNGSVLILDRNQVFKLFESLVYSGSSCRKINDLILAYLAVNSQIIDIPYVKINLIRLVNIGTKLVKNSSSSSLIFGDFLNEYLEKRSFWVGHCQETKFDFSYFETQVLSLLNLEKKNTNIVVSLTFLQKALNSCHQDLVDKSIVVLKQCFKGLKLDYQIALAQNIIESCTDEKLDVMYDGLLILQSLPLNTEIFVKLLHNFQLYKPSPVVETGDNVPKRRRRSSASTKQAMKKLEVAKLAEIHLRNVIMLLETFEKVGNEIEPSSSLLTNFFNLLSDLETLGSDGNLPVLYAQESLANCLIISIKTSVRENIRLESNSIRADVLVSIIRSSNSPQLQNKLLLVIAELAILEPEFILHSIMPIFTFMGAHTIKQDDEYSSYVIEQTISKVIPSLALTAKNNQSEEIEFLITSFVSAFNHIPRHRRVKLFSTLSKILGPGSSIHVILFLIGRQYVRLINKHKYNECDLLVNFVKSYMKNFDIEDQLDGIKRFLDLWSYIPIKKIVDEETIAEFNSKSIFGPEFIEMDDQELLSMKKNLLGFLDKSIILDHENKHNLPYLKLQVVTDLLNPRSDAQKVDNLLDIFNSIISNILGQLLNYNGDDELITKIVRKLYRLLNDVLSLLPIKFFADTIIRLISTSENPIITSNVIFLASKQFDVESSEDHIAVESANVLSEQLVQVIKNSHNSLETIQNSLNTLSSLVDKFQQKITHAHMMTLLSIVTDQDAFIGNFEHPELMISSYNLLSTIISVIGIKSIGYLPKILPTSFAIFSKSNAHEDEEYSMVQTSIGLLYSSLIKKLPQILVSNLPRILKDLLNENLLSKDIKLSILNIIFTYMDLKSLFKVLLNLWDSKDFQKTSSSTIGLYLNLLTQTIEKLEKSTTISVVSLFLKFMLSSFDFLKNNDINSGFNTSAISRIETLVFNCQLQFILKLNDRSFRPLFSSVISWSFDNNNLKTDQDLKKTEIFLKFFIKLQDNLKSVITNYYSYFLDNIYSLLNTFVSQSHDQNLKRLVLISLIGSFKYDQDEYWSVNTRFEKMSVALTQQLAVTDAKLGKHLTKAITTLAVKNSKVADHNKDLNKLLINHLKSNCSSQEKFATIKVFENIYVKVGTSWLTLLPQLVPIIAELLDDDDEKIELEVRRGLVKVIEDVMGESLDKYLD